jgi:hypothetical protein
MIAPTVSLVTNVRRLSVARAPSSCVRNFSTRRCTGRASAKRPRRSTYAKRSGVEATISQLTNAYALRRARYVGPKTHLQNIVTAVATNIARIDARLLGKPQAPTRTSKFAALRPAGTQPAWRTALELAT